MVLLENAVGLFVIYIVLHYSLLCYAVYWFLSQLVYSCNGYSGNYFFFILLSYFM